MNKASKNIVIPDEVRTFFGQTGGRSLLIKGTAGTGKTTFALQLLEELAEQERSLYLSTRVSDQALYQQFPWLEEEEMRGRIIDASRVLLHKLYTPEEGGEHMDAESVERLSSAKDFLRSVSDEPLAPPNRVDRTRLTVLLERNRMPEIERMYDRVEAKLPEKSMIAIDSIEGITNKYSLESEELVTCIQKDLVEGSNADIIFVLEDTKAVAVEFLVDGVVYLDKSAKDGRIVRIMRLEKLRGTRIIQPSYLITLNRGMFTSFDPFEKSMEGMESWAPIPDTPTHYSTGIENLDALLSGGYEPGSYNVIDIDENVTSEEYHAILVPLLLNFISLNRGIFAVLTGGDHAESVKRDLVQYVSEEQFEKNVRIADYFVPRSDTKYIMALGTRNKDEALRTWKTNQEALRGPENNPIMEYTGLDTLEYLQGGGVAIKGLLDGVAKIKISKDIGVGVLKPGLKLTQEIMNMADTYLKIISIARCPCIYGVKPKTMIYGIVNDEEKGPPHIKLVPIV